MSNSLQIIVWDVQHGNAIYMKSPNGRNVMFDIGTGSYDDGSEFSPLKYLKDRWSLDCLHYLVISHPHADHISDIRNMFDLDLKPRVLTRPKDIDRDLIISSNQDKYSDLVELYLELDSTYTQPVSGELDPSNPSNYGEVEINCFSQSESGTSNLNNYSVVAVIKYADEKIIIPGDIEAAGWKVLLEREDFQQAIKETTIFIASHHGREAGFHSDVFDYFKPDVVIVSDGKYSDTSVTGRYAYYAQGVTVKSRSTDESKVRYVLTTRNDGVIYIETNGSDKAITIK